MKRRTRPFLRHLLPIPMLLAGFALLSPHALAAAKKVADDPPPQITRSAAGTIEIGTLGGVDYRIDVPAKWNHGLVVFYHGYSESHYGYRATSPLNEQTGPMFDRGYAVIQSAYSTSGWALEQAYPETEELRAYFVHKYGQPEGAKPAKEGKEPKVETYVAGGSMGGALVTATLELNPKPYVGGLDLCGAVGPTYIAASRRFAWRAAFDFYFPGILPQLVPGPVNFQETAALRQKADNAMAANPAGSAAMRNLTGLHTDREVARDMVYFTFVLADLQARAGGNPFDNRNFLYNNTTPGSSATDNALNDGVHRYAADLKARLYLVRHFTPSGHLQKPMLALHTTYDPLIPIQTLALYSDQVEMAGFGENIVQQYVHREGHCTFTRDEVGRTFDELVSWVHTGKRPAPGLLK